MANSEISYAEFLQSLESNISLDIEKKQQLLSEKIEQFFEQTQGLLNTFVKDLQESTQTRLDEEIGRAKKVIDEYRRQKMEIIDENIVAILEKTLNIALGKKLTLSDQTQLIYEALEEAKKENFFA